MSGVDLHMHSNFSDGELSPQQLMLLAKEKNIQMLSLTDHDSLDGNCIAQQYAQQLDIQFINGVELSCQWSRTTTQKTFAVHIVALNMQNLSPMQELLISQKTQRAQRARTICAKLQHILKKDFLAEVRELVDGQDERITRNHIANILLNHRVVSRIQQAFDRFLKEGKAAYVPFAGVSMTDAINIIHASQGVAVLAHPTKYNLSATNIRCMIEQFAQAGGDAIELPHRNETRATRLMIDRLIADYQLKVSVGSDFHGSQKPWLSLGNVPSLTAEQVGIWQDF